MKNTLYICSEIKIAHLGNAFDPTGVAIDTTSIVFRQSLSNFS